MKKRCSVCNHPSREEIDQGLLSAVAYRALAAHGLSPWVLKMRDSSVAPLPQNDKKGETRGAPEKSPLTPL